MDSRVQNEQPRTIGRRRLVRSAATVAWAVPAIQLATAVPAFAGSGCDLTVTGSAHWRADGLNYIDISLDIANECDTADMGMTLALTVCGLEDITYAGTEYLPPGWSQVGAPNKALDPDGNGCYVLTFITTQALAGNGSTQGQFTVKTTAYAGTGNHRPAGSITAQVTASGWSSTPVPLVVPQVG